MYIWPVSIYTKELVCLFWKETELGSVASPDKHPNGPKMKIPNVDQRSVQNVGKVCV